MNDERLNSNLKRCDVLNIGVRASEVNSGVVNSGLNPTFTGINPFAGASNPANATVTVSSGTGLPAVANSANMFQQVGAWMPNKTAAGDFLKIQYAEVEVRCAITRKIVPAGSPVMLLGGMVVSQEAFENWLEEHLSALICRHEDVHTDTSGYDE